MAKLIITAPVKGWAVPLAEVPDAVFADCMLGDGVAIHPLANMVHAPIDGVITNIHAARHAISIRSDEGAEILIHIGLDTVMRGGVGFSALVAENERVSRGDPLIEFDMDAVAQTAHSLITPIIITNSEEFRIERRAVDQAVGVGEALITLLPISTNEKITASADATTLNRTVHIPLVHGIHARPAARISECARQFEAETIAVFGDKRANARGAVALMGLGVKMNDTLILEARGIDAAAALTAIGDLISSGMGELPNSSEESGQGVKAQTTGYKAFDPVIAPPAIIIPDGAIGGVTAAPGLAVGTARWLITSDIAIEADGIGVEQERIALDTSLSTMRDQLRASSNASHDAKAAILDAHLAFLNDIELLDNAHVQIEHGRSAGFAWCHAIGQHIAVLRNSGDARLAERADDLKDLEQQFLRILTGQAAPSLDFPPGTILLARDLLPSQLIALNAAHIAGIALVNGGPTSHVAILSASMNMPSLAAMGDSLLSVEEGREIILDADAGHMFTAPNAADLAHHRARLVERKRKHEAAVATALADCHTADNVRIELFGNIASVEDARTAVRNGAEGSGLLRTEFLFLDRAVAPDEDEQTQTYQAIADAMNGRPVIIRLLDIGGDKPAPYLPMKAETNPVLGLRGIRVGLAHPDILRTQIRAILRVQPFGQCKIMVPMIADLAELIAVRAIVTEEAAALGISDAIEVGVMIETPAAAVTADLLAQRADFLSVGTNDLTQYVLAMDRENSSVAAGIDALHPAVLRMISHTATGAAPYKRMVGTCGGLASDPLGIPLLIGLGVTELSVTPATIPEAKALVRKLDIASCREQAKRAMELPSAAAVRTLMRRYIEELN